MKNKKSMFFTIIAMAIISLFLVGALSYFTILERQTVNKRVETMNNFLFSTQENLEREIYAFGFRAIFLAGDQITTTGEYIPDIDIFVEEAFFSSQVNGVPSDILVGVNYNDLVESVNERGGRINLEINLSNPEIKITQEDPWNILVSFSFNLSAEDKGNLASWNRREEIKSYISIENFEDPLYIVNTNGKVSNKINQTIYTTFAEGNDISNLASHLANSYYIASASAPSFLDRLQGITSPNENGIESLVYLPKLSSQGITIRDKSCVDYIYFSALNPSYHRIQGMPSWFKLDDPHLDVYDVSHLAI